MISILFILKRKANYSAQACTEDYSKNLSTGLYNSASFMRDAVVQHLEIKAEIEVAVDANCIDRLVTQHKPKYAIIEALWVTPTKLAELARLHPQVTWIVRLHSELPFIAGESVAMSWIGDYLRLPNVYVAPNSTRLYNDLRSAYTQGAERIIYLPNYYPAQNTPNATSKRRDAEYVDVGCFGAIRPLKNHLQQAVAAIAFANSLGKKLRLHINVGRQEMNGSPVLRNLQGLFEHAQVAQGHELIMHGWMPHEQFTQVLAGMDVLLQVSLSETFNIVAADAVSQGVPIVVSDEIAWATRWAYAKPTCADSICAALHRAYGTGWLGSVGRWLNKALNQRGLRRAADSNIDQWARTFAALEAGAAFTGSRIGAVPVGWAEACVRSR